MQPGDPVLLRSIYRGNVRWCFRDEDWQLLWCVNLPAPLSVRGDRFDTTDCALDVVVAPDGTWRWQDEDDLAQALELGILDEAQAVELRAPEWGPLPLPEDWHVV